MSKVSGYIISIIALLYLAGGACAQSLPVYISPTRYEFGAYPGQEVSGTLNFWNGTDHALPIQVVADDFMPTGESGHIVVGGRNDAQSSIKNWVSIDTPFVTVSPMEEIKLDFAIRVPKSASPGTYWGTVLVRTLPASDANGSAIETKISSIVLLQVYGDAEDRLTLESFSAPKFSESLPVTFTARLKNTGNTLIKPKGSIEIRNAFGSVAAVLPLPESNTLPGYVRRIDVSANDELSLGRYTAILKASYGTPTQEITGQVKFWVIPWKSLGLEIIIFGGLVYFVIRRRKSFGLAWRALRAGEGR
jgi:hypothetical protein